MSNSKDVIEVFNINVPTKSSFVQKDKYDEVKRVLRQLMPKKSPGMTQEELAILVIDNVSAGIFEDRTKAGWWMKTVQLDLEARKVIVREQTKPLRWYYEHSHIEIIPPVQNVNKKIKKEILELPIDIKNILIQEQLLISYENRPFYQRNDYIQWIMSAKREETKIKRIHKMIEELKNGNIYMNMEYKRRES